MSDSSNIQPPRTAAQAMPPLNNAQDLINAFYGLNNAGERVELFFAVAESRPGEAFPWFVTILKNRAEPPLRALALQGLGHITHEPTRVDITSGQSDYSIALLHLLVEEIKGRKAQSNDLTRWAAAWAIEALRFSWDLLSHVEGGALAEPPERIRREIIDRKLDQMERVDRLNSRGNFTADYERHLEFWLYGGDAAIEFLNDPSRDRHFLEVVGDVINSLFLLGIEWGCGSSNREVQMVALEFAKQRFTLNEAIERRLYESLKGFLTEAYNSDIELQRVVAEVVIQAGDWLDPEELIKVSILCERWEKIVQLGESAIPILERIIWKALRFSTRTQVNLERQDKAVETISKINCSSPSRKGVILSKVLLHPDLQTRETASNLFTNHNIKSDNPSIQINSILKSIEYTWSFKELDFNNIAASELEQVLKDLEYEKDYLNSLFNNSINEAKIISNEHDLSITFIEEHLYRKTHDTSKLISVLHNEVSGLVEKIKDSHRKIDVNRELLKEAIERLLHHAKSNSKFPSSITSDLKGGVQYDALITRNPPVLTYNDCMQLLTQLSKLKNDVVNYIEKVFKKDEPRINYADRQSDSQRLQGNIAGGCILVFALFFLIGLFQYLGFWVSFFIILIPTSLFTLSYFSNKQSSDQSPFERIIDDLEAGWIG